MSTGLVIVVLAALNAWLGWKQNVRSGLAASVLLPAIIGVITTFAIPVPSDAGGPWVFVICFVVLLVVSLASLGLGRLLRGLLRRDQGNADVS